MFCGCSAALPDDDSSLMWQENFLLSYHSTDVFTPALTCTIITLYLLLKPRKSLPTWALFGAFLFNSTMFYGYLISYTVFDEFAAYHRYLTVSVLFSQVSLMLFAYNYPRNDHPKESVVMVSLGAVAAVSVYAYFVQATFGGDTFYVFPAHYYNLDAAVPGQIVAVTILSLFTWSLFIFLRKTIRHSHYEGFLSDAVKRPPSLFSPRLFSFIGARLLVGPVILLFPKGRDAVATRSFAVAILLLIGVGIANALNKAGLVSNEVYAYLYSIGSILALFGMFMAYMNNSPEPTTFMVKLVGISLVTLLLVLGIVSNITLTLNEASYDRERLAEVKNSRSSILRGEFNDLPESVAYVISRSAAAPAVGAAYELHYERDAVFSLQRVKAGEERMLARRVPVEAAKLQKEFVDLGPEEAAARATVNIQTETQPLLTRLYRDAALYYTHFDFEAGGRRYEVGFSYKDYRAYIHTTGKRLVYTILVSSFAILFIFPLFFRSSLVKPLNDLLGGVKEVNNGDFDVQVPIKVQDEIGYLAGSFNSMVRSIRDARIKLQDYAENLEEKVEERTREVREKMEEVQRLKVQQDGDYFLTSLLAKPLFFNANKSKFISTDFIIRQKKRFEFREREGDLGGDICVTGNLKFRPGPDSNRNDAAPNDPRGPFERWTMGMNGDAMGKSMQGAGGSLVMGVVMNSIMARSASGGRVLEVSPEQWLKDLYDEIHGVFKTFDGSMVISCVVWLVNDQTGESLYFNAEHPQTLLWRNGQTSFIEEGLNLRKLGLDSEFQFQVFRFQLQPGDVVLMGSDGRDDINLTPNAEKRDINEDEFLFLRVVQEVGTELHHIERALRDHGELTDDLSLLRIGFQESGVEASALEERFEENLAASVRPRLNGDDVDLDENAGDYDSSRHRGDLAFDELLERGKQLYLEGNLRQAINVLNEAYQIDQAHSRLNKLLGLLSFKGQDYEKAVELLSKYLTEDPRLSEFWIYLSLAEKKRGNYSEALRAAERLRSMEPENVKNLINLADLHRLQGDTDLARSTAEAAAKIDPEDRDLEKLRKLIG